MSFDIDTIIVVTYSIFAFMISILVGYTTNATNGVMSFPVLLMLTSLVVNLGHQNRMRRLHYVLFMPLALSVFIVMAILVADMQNIDLMAVLIAEVVIALSIIAMFGMTISRLHDISSSGWLGLLLFIPLVNIFLIIALIFAKGTTGDNRFGSDPRS